MCDLTKVTNINIMWGRRGKVTNLKSFLKKSLFSLNYSDLKNTLKKSK